MAENLTAGASVPGVAAADGSVSLSLGAGITDRVEITLTDPEGRTVSFIRPFRDPDGTTVIGPDGGVVEGDGGIRAVVPPGAVPDATFIKIGSITEAPAGEEALPTGFCHVRGIDLEITDADGNDVVAEEELKLSVSVPDAWDSSGCGCEFPTDESECCELSPDCEYPLVVLRGIRVFEDTPNEKAAYALNNIARIKDGRIETASPPFSGARASGPHLFVKPMYPAGFAIVTPSPMFGPSVTGMSCGNFGETFSDPLYHKTAPIFMIPGNRGFSVRIYSPAGDVLGEKSHSPREPADGFADLPIPAPADEGTMTVSESFPADEAGDVPIRVKVSVLFSRQVYEKSVTAETFSLRDGANRPVVGKTEIIYSDENSEVAAGIRFTPDRRLSFGTEYRILIAGVRGFDEEQVVTETLAFTTFGPGVTGSADVEYPYNISILNHDRIAVTDGTPGSSRGVVLLDVSDPVRLAEHALGGDTSGVYATEDTGVPGLEGQPVVLAVSGGMNYVSSFEVLKVTGENQDGLERAGAAFLSMDQTSLRSGRCIANVPCMPGIPRGVTLYGGDSAYIATMGIGVQGVSVTDDAVARLEADRPSNIRDLSLHSGSGSFMAAETMGDVILAGDIRKLWLLSPDLTKEQSADIPARAMHGIRDFVEIDRDGDGEIRTPNEDGQDERPDIVFVAGQDRTFTSWKSLMTRLPRLPRIRRWSRRSVLTHISGMCGSVRMSGWPM